MRRKEARLRGVTPRQRSGTAAENARLRRCRNGREELLKSKVVAATGRSYAASEVRDSQEKPPCARGQGRWLGGATQRWKLGTATGRTDPAPEARGAVGKKQPEEWWLCGYRRA